MHVEHRGAHRSQELVADIAEHVVLLVEAARVKEHHLHKTVGRVGKLLQAQSLRQPSQCGKGAFEKAFLALRISGTVLERLVDKSLAEINPAENVLVVNRNLVELYIGPRVLNVGFHQRRTLLDGLDDVLFAQDSLVDQCRLLRCKWMYRLVFGFLLSICAGGTHGDDQEGEGDLPKRHVKLLA